MEERSLVASKWKSMDRIRDKVASRRSQDGTIQEGGGAEV